jgi:hypothetical protein
VGVEADMRQGFGCGGGYVDAHVSARRLGGEKKKDDRRRGRKREKEQTIDGVLWPSRP